MPTYQIPIVLNSAANRLLAAESAAIFFQHLGGLGADLTDVTVQSNRLRFVVNNTLPAEQLAHLNLELV